MRLCIFGATGRAGQVLVEKALNSGHSVVAYARNPAKLATTDPNLRVVQGELSDMASIRRAVSGSDAVISLLGPTGRTKGTQLSDGMRNIAAAMHEEGICRLIATATPSAADPADRFKPMFRGATLAIRLTMGTTYRNIVELAQAVRDSGLDWTLVRLVVLTDAPTPGAVAGFVGDPEITMSPLSRDAIAGFLLAQLTDQTWMHKAPVIARGKSGASQ